MYRLYILEDDPVIAEEVELLAKSWDLEVRIVEDFRNVLEEVIQFDPHLVLVDIKLPVYDGYHWCNEIRKQSNVPILFLSSASDNMNIIMAMNMGADDFIAKPFDGNVLMAKIQAMLRRSYDFTNSAKVLSHRGVLLNTGDQSMSYAENKVELTKNEYRILHCLLENHGNVVSRESLMEKLWEDDSFVDENTLTVNVNRLRRKLEEVGLLDFVVTKFGVGYMIE